MERIDFQEKIELTELDSLEQTLPPQGSSAMAELQEAWRLHSPYQIKETLTSSPQGEIQLAQELRLQRLVALKRLPLEKSLLPQALKRFLNEAQITAQLNHPYIVPVYQLEYSPEGVFYTMKPVVGESLKALLQRARKLSETGQVFPPDLSFPILLEHFLKVCDAVDYAHCRGVVHRDLKPANIMIGPFHEVYVMDWGVACLCDTLQVSEPQPSSAKTLSGLDLESTQESPVMGTPRYLSPEQAAEKPSKADPRSDLYSLGLILQEMLTLKPAYAGDTLETLIAQARQAQRESLKKSPFPISPSLKAILEKATRLEPAQRYTSVAEFAEDLRRYQRREAVLAAPETFLQKSGRWIYSQRKAILIGVVLMIALSAIISTALLFQRRQMLLLAHQREEKLYTFFNQVNQQSQNIDSQFLQIETWLEGLSKTVIYYLEAGKPSSEPYYLTSNFHPPDLQASSFYRGPTSIDWPIWAIAWNVQENAVEEKIKQIIPLRTGFKRLFLRSAGDTLPTDPALQRQLIAEQGGAVVWATVVLKEGVLVYYPGKGHYEPHYDPRTRPYYKLADHRWGRHWGNPYIDGAGMGLILPVSKGLFNSKHAFLGTATLEMRFDYLIQSLLSMTDVPAVEQAYLVDEQGRVVVHSGQQNRSFPGKIFPDLKLPLFEVESVRKALLKSEHGFEVLDQGRSLYVYTRLANGWNYVVRANRIQLLGEGS
ncbi:hypothetical protein COW36_13265 [bacterium (Candidatus Blackallbacteria) CG17_big_fil_post_rev_8_21_14_2_50_48_46]|uniref:Protein kinase domain-containing protein n=1 Tax=bacterium (Candidatus Blackallbacteria) CG17_big_fil_post_rev_8_21_14_2_50_48_46 TaxID=2014261 RepID=A0A2M7G3K1_9BACT|nr:MAG: hypothetical protein COW64_21880 [bacterium (Candidatus Blackallbacteria) CG18_big_fil_WC_8_21_14_2_50_49_26]PIW16301.1 MAG: hypothetical protein COW36_13265 [bacterium (Candidatus Blackallbacteria) CG17_big_fil_post_rev_8_21_14_2_50_48_46]PIW45315.1 MAG: hypothetical protein COW20_20500 [bacterium (Candidatus Blackallbacteria) CG13_big_fil_rev_8_21_14_2_50_49_14]